MNYRHDFHAGNFADVFKHIVLVRILLYLQRKPTPYRVIDTHAGSGRYDLGSDLAARSGEWRNGIGRLDAAAMAEAARALVEPYLTLVGEAVHGSAPYPGSPALALALARPFDRMTFCELHPAALVALRKVVGRDKRAKALELDGYTGLNAFIPPVERRGVVLIDPPFEAADEFDHLAAALIAAHRKWRDGIYLAWFPIKDRRGVERLSAVLAAAGLGDVLRLEMAIGRPQADGPLMASGLIIVNAPYVLDAEMDCVLPELVRQLGDGNAVWRCHRISGLT